MYFESRNFRKSKKIKSVQDNLNIRRKSCNLERLLEFIYRNTTEPCKNCWKHCVWDEMLYALPIANNL